MKRSPLNFITKDQYIQDRYLAIQPEHLIPGDDTMLRRAFTIGETLAAIGAKVAPIFCVEERVSIEGIEKAKAMFEVSFHYVAEDGTATGNSRRLVNEEGIIVSRFRHDERGYFLPQQEF